MKTDDLIASLSAGQPAPQRNPAQVLALALLAGCICAAAAMFLSIGPRPDFLQAADGNWRFLMKFVVTATLAASAYVLLRRAIYPEGLDGAPLWVILAAPAMLLAAVLLELMLLPKPDWGSAAVGTNGFYCLTLIPLFGLLPLGFGLWAVRQGAPTRPALSGFLVGLMAGGIAAAFYAAHCTDDSPLFVALWYTVAILVLAGAGAAAGNRLLRW